MTTPRALDVGLLEEFAARLEALGVPAGGCAQPGLSEDAMQDLVAPLGLSLPREARICQSADLYVSGTTIGALCLTLDRRGLTSIDSRPSFPAQQAG